MKSISENENYLLTMNDIIPILLNECDVFVPKSSFFTSMSIVEVSLELCASSLLPAVVIGDKSDDDD